MDEFKDQISARHAKIFALLHHSEQDISQQDANGRKPARYVDSDTTDKHLALCKASFAAPPLPPLHVVSENRALTHKPVLDRATKLAMEG